MKALKFHHSVFQAYLFYLQKAGNEHRNKDEIDQVMRSLTGLSQVGLDKQIKYE